MTNYIASKRIDWIDHAKGICILLVVLMHSTLGVERLTETTSWLADFIAWATPFRMPDFFLISGLFLANRINRPWRSYIDTKVIHFVYFYVLWLTITFCIKAPLMLKNADAYMVLEHYFLSFIQPFSSLWFIYLLAIFFVVTKLMQKLPMITIWLSAVVLNSLQIHTGSIVVDEFAKYFVFFFSGYVAADFILAKARQINSLSSAAIICGLVSWVVVHSWVMLSGWANLPVVTLALGYIGAGAVITLGILFTRYPIFRFFGYGGANSIVIYTAFFVFMASSRTLLLKLGIIHDTTALALVVTATSLIGPIILFQLTRNTPLRFLFERPDFLKWKIDLRNTHF